MRSAGFTLLEMLVGLVVLSLIMAGLSQGARFGLRALTAQGSLLDGSADLATADRTLRRLIERMEPGQGRQPAPIEGAADRLGFTSTLPAATLAPLRWADMALLVDGNRLVLRWMPHRRSQRFQSLPAEAELLRGVNHIELAYGSRDGRWTSAWAERSLPALVRVRIVFMAGDRRHWPDIVAAPLQERPET